MEICLSTAITGMLWTNACNFMPFLRGKPAEFYAVAFPGRPMSLPSDCRAWPVSHSLPESSPHVCVLQISAGVTLKEQFGYTATPQIEHAREMQGFPGKNLDSNFRV